MGAYSQSLRTNFNGFSEIIEINVADEPIISIYQNENYSNSQILQKEFY